MNIKDAYIHNGSGVVKELQVTAAGKLQLKRAEKTEQDVYVGWEDVHDLTEVKPTAAGTADKVGHKLTFSGGVTGNWDGSADKTVSIPTKASWNYDDVYLKLEGGTLTGDLKFTDMDNGIRYEVNYTSGGWARSAFSIKAKKLAADSSLSEVLSIGAYGDNTGFVYSYIGPLSYSGDNLRFYPDGSIKIGSNVVYHAGNLSIGTLLGSTAIGDSDEPVYWSGSAFVKAGAYPTKSSWNYDDVYLKDIALDTGNSTDKNKDVSLTNGNVNLKLFKSVNGAESEDSKVKIYGATNVSVTTDANGDIKITGVDSVTNATNATNATYAANVGASGTAGTNYVTAANVISMYNWYNTITAEDTSNNTAIDKWNEIVSFLNGIADTSTLSGILAGYAASGHNHDDKYLKLTGGTLTGNLVMKDSMVRFISTSAFTGERFIGPYSSTSYDLTWYDGGTWRQVWHAGNHGSGSGLDADLLDGVQGENYYNKTINRYGLENLVSDVAAGGKTELLSGGKIRTTGVSGDTYFYVNTVEGLDPDQIYTLGWYVENWTGTGTWTFVASNATGCLQVAMSGNGWFWATGHMVPSSNTGGTHILIDDWDRPNPPPIITMSKFILVKGNIFPEYIEPTKKLFERTEHTHTVTINGVNKTINATNGNSVDLGSYVKLSGDTMSGSLTISASTFETFSINRTNIGSAIVGGVDSSGLLLRHTNTSNQSVDLYLKANDGLRINNNLVWHSGNDGHTSNGTGPDADLLDNHHASDFQLITPESLFSFEDFSRIVIGLCEVSPENDGNASYTIGDLVYHKGNGLVHTYCAKININNAYLLNYGAEYSMLSDYENTSVTARDGSGFRACTFVYNNKHYAGLEFYEVQAGSWTFHGNTNFGIFAVAYYNTNTQTVVNSEINNSLSYNSNTRLNYHISSVVDADTVDGKHASDFMPNQTYYWANVAISTQASNTTAPSFDKIFLYDANNDTSWQGRITCGDGLEFLAPLRSSQKTSILFGWRNTVDRGIVISSSGNVGIGKDSPSYKLDVSGDICIPNEYSIKLLNSSNVVLNGLGHKSGAGICVGGYENDSNRSDIYISGNRIFLRTFNTSNSTFANTVSILGNGNVGISDSSPAEKLTVAGYIKSSSGFKLQGVTNAYILTADGSYTAKTNFYQKAEDRYGLENLCIGVTAGGQANKVGETLVTSGEARDTYFYFNTSEPLDPNQTYTIGFYVEGWPDSLTGEWPFPVGVQGNSSWVVRIKGNGWCWATGKYTGYTGAETSTILDDAGGPSPRPSLTFSKFTLVKGNIFPYFSVAPSKLHVEYATSAGSVDWSSITNKPDSIWSTVAKIAVTYSVYNGAWTETITLPTDVGSYVLTLITGTATFTGLFSIGSSDAAKDEISLHMHGEATVRLYARTDGTKLKIASSDASATNRSIVIKYKRLT